MVSVIYHVFRKLVFYAECHYAECRYAEFLYAECHHVECRYVECRGALIFTFSLSLTLKSMAYVWNNKSTFSLLLLLCAKLH